MRFGKRLATEASSSPFKEWSLDYKAMKKVLKEWEKGDATNRPRDQGEDLPADRQAAL